MKPYPRVPMIFVFDKRRKIICYRIIHINLCYVLYKTITFNLHYIVILLLNVQSPIQQLPCWHLDALSIHINVGHRKYFAQQCKHVLNRKLIIVLKNLIKRQLLVLGSYLKIQKNRKLHTWNTDFCYKRPLIFPLLLNIWNLF